MNEYPGRGCGGALKHSTSDQQVKGRGRGADQPENDIQANPEGKHRFSPEAVGKWTPQQLSEAEAKHVHDDDQLAAIILCDAEMRADVGERRDHRVDREGVERHQPSEHGDGLTRARARPRAGKVLQGYGHGRPRQWPSCSHVPRGGRKGRLFAWLGRPGVRPSQANSVDFLRKPMLAERRAACQTNGYDHGSPSRK